MTSQSTGDSQHAPTSPSEGHTEFLGSDSAKLSVPKSVMGDWTPSQASSSSGEDYDDMSPDPASIIHGAKGGGYGLDASTVTPETGSTERLHGADDPPSYESIQPASLRNRAQRRRSVQVILERTAKKGRYILTADDPQVREILKYGIERQNEENGGKPRRKQFRDLVFTRRFTTFDRQNPVGADTPFYGFFTLFWLALALLLIRIAAQNWRVHGSVFGGAELLQMMFDREVVVMGALDGVMTAATVGSMGIQKLIANGYMDWNRSGWIVQNIWQSCYLAFFIGFTFYRHWPWTHTIFIVLHSLVYLMKQHSYAFYNGYLSQVLRRKNLLQTKLKQLEDMEDTTPSSPYATRSEWLPSSIDTSPTTGESSTLRKRALGPKSSTNLSKEKSEISTIAAAIESGQPLDGDQLRAFSSIIATEIAALEEELSGKCSNKQDRYPQNLTLTNFVDWTVLPTLVYELEYPRQDTINWWYVAEKTAATFGVIWVMMVISQAYIYPIVATTVAMKEQGMPLSERWTELPWLVSDMLFPLLLEQLLSWYVIWECVLNVLAEVTRFADRGFYGDWWNSVSWDQYARDWNRPVHNFLLRHVYHSSISAFHLSRASATFVTFFLSACVHELVMFCLFKKVRGYLFLMQLMQVPLAMLSRTKLLKGRTLLGNVIFWIGLFIGPSLLTSLYLIV